mmetsp:Transcript_74368/g.205251  ORF Transcript_74368/g.205251 Transcript_74368/m.205251 type:complete len:293 (+) Transcript_74368:2799-3677(+)
MIQRITETFASICAPDLLHHTVGRSQRAYPLADAAGFGLCDVLHELGAFGRVRDACLLPNFTCLCVCINRLVNIATRILDDSDAYQQMHIVWGIDYAQAFANLLSLGVRLNCTGKVAMHVLRGAIGDQQDGTITRHQCACSLTNILRFCKGLSSSLEVTRRTLCDSNIPQQLCTFGALDSADVLMDLHGGRIGLKRAFGIVLQLLRGPDGRHQQRAVGCQQMAGALADLAGLFVGLERCVVIPHVSFCRPNALQQLRTLRRRKGVRVYAELPRLHVGLQCGFQVSLCPVRDP